ncbi:MAG: sporulation protein Cse60 [Bacilli bacterium]|nr:sporulation protein Cse60 [Bacilli bacterium]
MKVKIIDEEHEKDLEDEINEFIVDKEIYDIKYSTSIAVSGEDQIFCYSALIVYRNV